MIFRQCKYFLYTYLVMMLCVVTKATLVRSHTEHRNEGKSFDALPAIALAKAGSKLSAVPAVALTKAGSTFPRNNRDASRCSAFIAMKC